MGTRIMKGTALRAMPLMEVIALGRLNPGNVTTVTIRNRRVVADDSVIAQLHTKGSTPRTILTAACLPGVITIVLSGAAATDHVLQYMVVRNLDTDQVGAKRRVY